MLLRRPRRNELKTAFRSAPDLHPASSSTCRHACDDEPGHDDAEPVLVALPFKRMLFVLADGWNLLIGSLAASFAT